MINIIIKLSKNWFELILKYIFIYNIYYAIYFEARFQHRPKIILIVLIDETSKSVENTYIFTVPTVQKNIGIN